MNRDERKRFNAFMSAFYPHLDPCCDCEYWRSLYASKGAERGRYFTHNSTTCSEAMGAPCCHYAIDNNQLMDEHTGPFWEGIGNCKHFKERDKSKYKPKTMHLNFK